MKHHLSATLDKVITFLLFLVVGITPLLFSSQLTEFYEMPKLVFLMAATILLVGLWIFSWIVKGKVVLTKTPLNLPLLLLLVVVVASTVFSTARYIAIYGNFPTVHGSAVSWIVYILLYFVAVSHLKTVKQIKTLLYVLYASVSVVALVSVLSFFRVFLPVSFAQAVNFSPTGSSFSAFAFMLLMLPLPLLSLIKQNKYMPAPVALVLSILLSVTIVLIGSPYMYVALFLVFVLALFASRSHQTKQGLALFALPVVATILTLALAYVPLPGGLNQLQKLEANFPKEIQLPLSVSWKVAVSSFRDAPFIGTGPSSFLFNFTNYKPAEYNQLKFWNFSFDTAHDEILQVVATLGLLGLVVVLLFAASVVRTGLKNLSMTASDENQDTTHVILPALAISGLMSILLFALHATTLVSVVVTLIVLAALMASQKSVREGVMEFSIGIKATTANDKQFDLFPILVFIIFLALAVPVLLKFVPAVTADYYHRLALSQANKNGTLTYQYLQKAESMNPYVDLYRVDMAQTNFALANALAAKAAASKDPATALTNQEKQTIQTLLSQAINEGRAAVALSPRSSRNWEVLASIYRNIAGVAQNALAFSLDAYGRAIQQDPLNPVLRINAGSIYQSAKSYDLAIRFFTDAANLKPDYANAYYNLTGAYIGKNDFQSATLVAQQTVTLLEKDKNSADYKVAAKLLEDLKTKAASEQTTQQTPATQQTKLPPVNVPVLNNPPAKVATPAAVKTNPNAVLPKITPTTVPTTTTP